ncbi:MAG: FAD:protein FMN transferase [Ignavibacteriaceae bacterium]
MKFIKELYFLISLLLFSISINAQTDTTMYKVSVMKYLMGTTVETTASTKDVNLCKQAFIDEYNEMQRIENLLSCEKDSSEISAINHASGLHPVKVSYETLEMVKRAKAYCKKYKGVFDVTIGPLSDLWGFSTDKEIVLPKDKTIKALDKLVNYKYLKINEEDTTVFLEKKGMLIDLGGIAKGYAIDRGSAVLKKWGITNFILNAGGDIYVSGTKDKETLWKVGIKHPRKTNDLVAEFNLKDYAVATSGDYERFKIINGIRYHHILNPATGYPGRLSESSTVLAPTAEEADATATYVFIVGWKEALTDKNLDYPLLIVSSDGTVHYNKVFQEKYNLEMAN